MRFVNDDRVVGIEETVVLRLRQQDAVGHQLDVVALADFAGETHLIADDVAQPRAEFLCDPVGDGARCDAARLRMADQSTHAALQRQADLRQLRGLARSRLAAHDHDLMRADRRCDFLSHRADRQFFGKARQRQILQSLFDAGPRTLQRRFDRGQFALGRARGPALDPALQRPAVGAHHAVQRAQQPAADGGGIADGGCGAGGSHCNAGKGGTDAQTTAASCAVARRQRQIGGGRPGPRILPQRERRAL